MRKVRICLDAGHYGDYNSSPVVPEYYESRMTWKLHLLLKAALEQYGVEVVTTRSERGKDMALYQRGAASNGCDLFMSLHSNAVGGRKGNETVDRVDVYTSVSGAAHELADRLGRCIRETMGTAQGHYVKTRKGSRGDYYGVLRGATAVGTPGLLVEHSFHSCTRSAKWLLDEENLAKLAQAEAETIAMYYGLEAQEDAPEADEVEPDIHEISAPVRVRVAIDNLIIRTGPGTAYPKTGRYTGKGVFTIIETRAGDGSALGWGRLKSGAGWIALDYATVEGGEV